MTRIPDPWQPSETLATAIVNFLRQPMTLAVLASTGAHGAFFLGLPLVTGSNAPDLRTVNVVQLTPEEQAKLSGAVPQLPNQPTPRPT
ncbi:MAG: hypothetical protein VKJ24_04735, partial [Synechococcales bacterium]|nr:hypothetical protein [Synechococcales bacterium]